MPNPAITLKLRRFRQRFGVAAPRVAIRTHFPWYWYAIAISALVVFVAVVVWWLAQRDEAVNLRVEVAQLRHKLAEADQELTALRARTGTEQSAAHMQKTAQQQLLTRLKALEQENVALKEDLSLFERLVPADAADAGVRIEKLTVVAAAEPNRYRYRLLIRYQASKQEREFRGRLQLSVVSVQGGKESQMILPGAQDGGNEFLVETRHFLRKEGGFSVATGARLKSVEARLLQAGVIKAKFLVTL